MADSDDKKEAKIISLRAYVPEQLKNDFKAACARQGETMSDVLIRFMEDYVAEDRAKS